MVGVNRIVLIVGGIGGETTEAYVYAKIFQKIFSKAKIKLIILYKLNKHFNDKEIEVLEIGSVRSLNPVKKLCNLFKWIQVVKSAKKDFNPDISISLGDPSNLVNILTQRNEKTYLRFSGSLKFIHLYQDSKLYGFIYRFLYSLVIRFLYNRRANHITCINRYAFDDYVKRFGLKPEKSKVVYNPIYFEEIQKLKDEPLGEHEAIFKYPVLITAGRLTKPKGQWYLIRIFKALKEEFPELKLVILGEGELKSYLVELAESLGLNTFVWDRDKLSEDFDLYFLGFQKNPFKFISRARLFLFPSLWEGFGNALIEAMACGVPVISSDCKSGPREILAADTDFEYETREPEFASYGVLMPPLEVKYRKAEKPLEEREKMWVEVVKRFLKDEELAKSYAQRALERAKEFDIERIVEEWRKVLTMEV